MHTPSCPCSQQGLKKKEGPALSSADAGWELTERKFSSVHSQYDGVGCLGPESLRVPPDTPEVLSESFGTSAASVPMSL